MPEILPHLIVGPAISFLDVPRLRRAGVSAILSLQEPGADILETAVDRIRESCAALAPEIEYRNVAIRDYDPGDLVRRMPAALASLRDLIGAGRVVYLHCCEGVNRAPSVALGHLVLDRRLAVDVALERLLGAHQGARPYAELVAWLRERSG